MHVPSKTEKGVVFMPLWFLIMSRIVSQKHNDECIIKELKHVSIV